MSLLSQASLCVTPSAYKEGTLYSVIPSDGSGDMSVGRATTATRVNSAGLVELVPYNLVNYSEQFDNAAWISAEVTLASGQSSPLGTNTAFKITGASATNAFLLQVGIPVTSGNTYTASVYLKGATSGSVSLRVDSGSTAPNNPVSYTTEWQRFTYTFTAGSTTATAILGGYNTWTGSEEIFVYGFQLVEGSVAKDYQKTETRLNIPRLDYSNGTCPSLLVEPQRTNLALYSSSFDNAAWLKAQSTITANSTTSPSGLQNADTLTADGTNNEHTIRLTGLSTLTSGTTYTTSIYAKKGTNNFIQLVGTSAVYPTTTFANFDLNNGVIGSFGANVISTITDVGNGWYRCSMTAAAISTSNINTFIVSIVPSATSTRGEINTLNTNVFLWGAQLESGSYPTSYIPTTSASVTRNGDVISKTGISSLIGQTEGTVFVDINWEQKNGVYFVNSISNGTTSNEIFISFGNSSDNALRFSITSGGSTSVVFNTSALTSGRYKIALAYANNDATGYINGTQIFTDSSVSVPATSQMKFSRANDTLGYSGTMNAAVLWQTRLTNDELATLTTI